MSLLTIINRTVITMGREHALIVSTCNCSMCHICLAFYKQMLQTLQTPLSLVSFSHFVFYYNVVQSKLPFLFRSILNHKVCQQQCILFKIHTFIIHTRGRSGRVGRRGSSHTVMEQLIKMQGQGILDMDWLISMCGIIQDCNWWQLVSQKPLK